MKTQEQCQEMKAQLINKFKLAFPSFAHKLALIENCTFDFNPRMRTTLGRAHYILNKIELNTRALGDNPEKFDSTFAHELAHLIAYAAFERHGKGHGRGWKATMRALGFSPERTHKVAVSHLARPHEIVRFAKCSCRSEIAIKPRRYLRMLKGTNYRCSGCRGRLELLAPDFVSSKLVKV